MKRTPDPGYIILAILLIVTFVQVNPLMPMWDPSLMPLGRTRQRYNPRRNRDRWKRRLHWSRTLDVLHVLLQVDAGRAAELMSQVTTAEFAEVCPVAG